MDPDKYQQAWQAQSSRTRVTIDADLLLKEVQRSQGHFRTAIFWRDFREVGVALVMLPLWFYLGRNFALPWTWYLVVPALLWVAGFLLVDRRRHKRKPIEPGEPLLATVNESLTQVDHQIWLLRNVFWWYLLPFIIPILAFFAQVAWLKSKDWVEGALAFGTPSALVAALYYLVYYLNQLAVRVQLEPRRKELFALRAGLTDEEPAAIPSVGLREAGKLRRWLIGACLLLMVICSVTIAVKLSGYRSEGRGYPRLSPFASVRWQGSHPEVKIGPQWYQLVSLDDLPAAEIVTFSRRTYGDRWQKRFEEDLVELLCRMGHPPQETVKLVVRPLTSSVTQVLEGVPMTNENRRAIKAAADSPVNTKP